MVGGLSLIEVNYPEASKGVVLQKLARRLDIPMSSVVYFGDSLNDIPAMEVCCLFPIVIRFPSLRQP